jgi:hypothetical protein
VVTERASEDDAIRKQLSLTPHGHEAAGIAEDFKSAMAEAMFGGDSAAELRARPGMCRADVRPTPTNWRSPCSPRCKAAHCSPTPYAIPTSCRAKCSALSGGSTPSPRRGHALPCRRRSESGGIPRELETAIENTWAVGCKGRQLLPMGNHPPRRRHHRPRSPAQ